MSNFSESELQNAVRATLMKNKSSLESLTVKQMRRLIEQQMSLSEGALEDHRDRVTAFIKKTLKELQEEDAEDEASLSTLNEDKKRKLDAAAPENPKPQQKAKREEPEASNVDADGLRRENGEISFDLGSDYTRVTVRKFKSMKLIDIRKFWKDKDGSLKHSAKGISLQENQWDLLKKNVELVDKMLSEI